MKSFYEAISLDFYYKQKRCISDPSVTFTLTILSDNNSVLCQFC